MPLRYRPQRLPPDESIRRQLPVFCGQVFNRQSQVIDLVELRHQIRSLL